MENNIFKVEPVISYLAALSLNSEDDSDHLWCDGPRYFIHTAHTHPTRTYHARTPHRHTHTHPVDTPAHTHLKILLEEVLH